MINAIMNSEKVRYLIWKLENKFRNGRHCARITDRYCWWMSPIRVC